MSIYFMFNMFSAQQSTLGWRLNGRITLILRDSMDECKLPIANGSDLWIAN